MDQVLRPHAECAAAYLDVIIHSDTWQQHVQRVVAVLESMRWAPNPGKCTIGWREVRVDRDRRYHSLSVTFLKPTRPLTDLTL